MNKLLVWDEDNMDFMIIGSSEKEIESFNRWAKNNLYDSNISVNIYKVPKGKKSSNVYIISTGTKTIREDSYNYWIKNNFIDVDKSN